MSREVEIAALTLDPGTNSPVVVLREKDGESSIPIWIGFVEASAIAMELEKIKVGRPLTHDLLKSVMTNLQATLKRIEVTDLKDNTYFATLFVDQEGAEIQIDSRPSDAIALAVRFGAPIFIADKVFETSQKIQDDARTQKSPAPGEEDAIQSVEDAEAAKAAAASAAEEVPSAFAEFREENREEWAEILAKLDPTKLSKQ